MFLFYGENEGYKIESIKNIHKKLINYKIIKYEEKEIIENSDNFMSEILNKSLFDEKKIIVINRSSDKSISIIQDLYSKEIFDTKIIFVSEILQKKSKLRSYFEKEKQLICVPFYNDKESILVSLANNFLKKKNINISSESINLIVQRSAGDRINLYNEIKKIENFSEKNKKISYENISKLTNLAENYSVSEITDNCLAKNIKKIVNILNENNFSSEDCITILRTLLYKSKRLLNLISDVQNTNNLDKTINSYKPTIFWKEKEIVKKQVKIWTKNDVIKLIDEICEIEILIKKNSTSSLNIIYDFIINKSKAA